VKKIFGIVLALALVLSMSVMAAPVSAAHDIEVDVDNPLVSPPLPANPITATYVINFTMMQPLDTAASIGVPGEYIDITFPATTDLAWVGNLTPCDIIVVGPNSAPGKASYRLSNGDLTFLVLGTTLRIYLTGTGTGLAPGNLVAGDVGVTIECVGNPREQCNHTLWVGTTQETAAESPEYNIFAFMISLVKGWNLISLPVIPEDSDITVVLADLIARADEACLPPFTFKVYYYDCSTWYAYNNGSYASLDEMTECHAYWINVSEDIDFYVKGEYYPAPPGPPLKKCYHECWNMVGFTSDVVRDPFTSGAGMCSMLSAYFASISPPTAVIYILRWDTGLQTWGSVFNLPAVAVAPNANCLVPGEGYWVSFSADACFAVPPPGV
jgi:hypothetical protein